MSNNNQAKNTQRGSVNVNPTINIWQEILKESMTKKDLEEANVFFFGDKFSGKRTLIKYINKELLQKNEFDDQGKRLWGQDENNFSKYSLLDYTFLSVKKYNEYDSESIGKINIWMANDMITKEVFQTVIKPENIVNSVCVIVADLSRPWEIIENLKRWTNFIYDTFSNLMLKLPFEKQQEMRDKKPQFEDDEKTLKKEIISEESKELKMELPLKEGLLKINCGIPIIFDINKSDIVLSNTDRKRFEEDSEFIIKHIRNLAIGYGATIIYTSPKRNINLYVLYEYILHRIYKFDFVHKTNHLDKDSFFIPAGYDSLAILKSFDMNNDLAKIYEERIPAIKAKNIVKEQEVVCEDISAILNSIRDSKKMGHASDYNSNSNSSALDDKGKKKLEILSGIRKQDYNTSVNTNVSANNYNSTINSNFESSDNKAKNDFQKFMVNKKDTGSSSKLQSLKTDNNKNLKDNIKKSVEEKLKALGDKSDFKLKLNNLKK